MARLAGILCWKDVYSEAIYQIMVAKHLIMTRSLLEKMDSEQPVQIFLLLQDEILENQAELLKQNNAINERVGIYQKNFKIFWMKIMWLKVY